MKKIQYIPRACQENKDGEAVKAPTFRGMVTLKAPNIFERNKLKMILMAAISSDEGTSVETLKEAAKKANVRNLMEKMAELIEQSAKFYELVELENLSSGVVHKSFDDLSYDPDAEEILSEIAQELAGGLKLSKNS